MGRAIDPGISARIAERRVKMKTGRTISEFVSIVEPYIDEFAAEVGKSYAELGEKLSKISEEYDITNEEAEIFYLIFAEKVSKILEKT